MKLRGRQLSLRMQGEDVALLQRELRQLGTNILPEEAQRSLFGPATLNAVVEFQRAHRLDATGIVDERTASAINAEVDALPRPEPDPQPAPVPVPKLPPFVVRGHVRLADGGPAAGLSVQVLDRDLRSSQDLGRARTDARGHFERSYSADGFARAEKLFADLAFRVENERGIPLEVLQVFRLREQSKVLVGAPRIIFNAQADEIVELVLGNGHLRELSEFERYLAELTPLLQNVLIGDLTEDDSQQDITFLTSETGIEPSHIALLIVSTRHARTTELPPDLFYGLFRQGLPTNLPALLVQPTSRLKAALLAAVEQNIIPTRSSRDIDGLTASLQRLVRSHILRGRSSLGDLLGTSTVPRESQEAFLELYARHNGPLEEFWRTLRAHPEFQVDGLVDSLEFTLQMGQLTQDTIPLVESLQRLREEGRVRTSRDLVKLKAGDWEAMISASRDARTKEIAFPPTVGEGSEAQKTNEYAETLLETLREAFPTDYVFLGIGTERSVDAPLLRSLLELNPTFQPREPITDNFNWGDAAPGDRERATESINALRRELTMFPELDHRTFLTSESNRNPVRAQLSRFFENVPDFDFRDTHIDTYLTRQASTAFSGIEDAEGVRTHLKRLQRVFLIAPRYEHMEALLGAGLDSAFAIASIPAKNFVMEIGGLMGGAAAAMTAYSKASQKTAVSQNVMAAIHPSNFANLPVAIGNGTNPVIKLTPTLESLFGSSDLCDCQHCRSGYGPAAYFVDLLQFLRKSGGTILNRLLARRPDLEHVKLTCENTSTPLPYVDLVNEILEFYVAHGGLTDGQELAKDTVEISAEELSVNPQYLNDAAYERLRDAVYASSLPFNRPVEVARAYLESLGSSRHEVMATFQSHGELLDPNDPGSADTKTPSDLALACEYLKITSEEYDILVSGFVGGQVAVGGSLKSPREFFGYASNQIFHPAAAADNHLEGWRVNLARVPEFLRRTGVSYVELVELTKTRFINPGQVSVPLPQQLNVLFSQDSVCDLSQTTIRHLNAPLALVDTEWMKLHKLLRLWRKLGWSIEELDKAIQALGASDIDQRLIEELAALQWLTTTLNVPLLKLLSLSANIDTDGREALYIKLFQNKGVLNPVDDAFRLRYSAPLSSLPNITFPVPMQERIAYDAVTSQLQFVGMMTTGERELLAGLSEDEDYRLAVEHLFQMRTSGHAEVAMAATEADEATLSKHAPAILAALHLNQGDLVALRKAAALADETSALSLENLSRLYRHALLAKSLNVPVKNFVELMRLMGVDASLPNSPHETVKFARRATKVLRSGLSVSQLSYLFRHVFDAASGVAPAPGSVIDVLNDLQEGLRSILQETVLTPDPFGELLRGKLGMVLDGALVSVAMDVIEGKSSIADADKDRFIDENLGSFLPDLAEAKNVLLASPDLTAGERRAYVLSCLRGTLMRRLVRQSLGDALDLDGAVAEVLLEKTLTSPSDASRPLISDFLSLVGDGLAVEYFSNTDLLGPPLTPSHVSPAIDLSWDDGSPDEASVPDSFSARWTGWLRPQHDEMYSFYVRARGGVRLWVEDLNQPLVDQWSGEEPFTEHVSVQTLALSAGQVYPIRLEYRTDGPGGSLSLGWSSLYIPKALIPQSQLYSSTTFVPGAGLLASHGRLSKVALLANTFRVTPEELAYLAVHGADFGGFDLNGLPLDRADPLAVDAAAAGRFEQWEQVEDLFTLRASVPGSEVSLLAVIGAPSAQDAGARLAEMTGWDAIELQRLISAEGLSLPDHALTNAAGVWRLQRAFRLAQRLGLSTTTLRAWAVTEPNTRQAQEIVHTVKAKYDEGRWLTIAKPVNDALREKQRAALLAYIMADEKIVKLRITNTNQLFEYFLIDVNMSACFMTSRIKQAISSVQLFTQRCLMDLEVGVSPDAVDDERWKWMKNYRVWEANRKVFLYPENWIEPELRDDKTPFFKDLETHLLQNDLTPETIEQAYLAYLDKLDEVGRLEPCGVYRHREGDTDTVHIFARTFNPPHLHYYRQFLVKTGIWTPWEQLDHVEGDHLVPVVYNRHLHLFWATFEEQPDPSQDLTLIPMRSEEEIKHEEDFDVYLSAHEKWVLDTADYQNKKAAWDTDREEKKKSHVEWETKVVFPTIQLVPVNKPGYDIGEYPGTAPEELLPPTIPDLIRATPTPPKRWAIKLSWIERHSTGWSAKHTGKVPLYVTGDQPQDYRFEAYISLEYRMLMVGCYRRVAETSQKAFSDDVLSRGGFFMKGCGNEVLSMGLSFGQLPPTERVTPDMSRISFMRFDQEVGGDGLTFYGPKPYSKEYPILNSTPTPYRVLHPSDDIEPKTNGLTGALYPFFYQDDRRTYFALPVRDTERPATGIVAGPKPGFYFEFQDEFLAKIRLPDKGDPGPLESGLNQRTRQR